MSKKQSLFNKWEKSKMKKYEKPEIIITKFEVEDVIAASSGKADIDGGITEFLDSWLGTGVDGGNVNFLESWFRE